MAGVWFVRRGSSLGHHPEGRVVGVGNVVELALGIEGRIFSKAEGVGLEEGGVTLHSVLACGKGGVASERVSGAVREDGIGMGH